jgi:CheY-like chemotaxis protein
LGYQIIEAADGQAGWDAYQADKDRIDLVLMDLSMPGMSGLELLKRLLVFDPDVPAIILTGNVPDEVDAPGARAVLGKPLLPKLMFATIRKVLDGEA